jgi:hypothetical protein
MDDVHLAIVIITALTVLYADKQGMAWMRGKTERLAKRTVDILHVIVSVGISGLILTGGLMLVERGAYLLAEPIFIAKMVFVAALVVNGFFIGMLSELSVTKRFADLSKGERFAVLASGGVSAIGWISAIALGFLL